MVLDNKVRHHGSEMREMAARLCSDYLQGGWKHVTSSDITLTRVTGGLSNWLYCVSLNPTADDAGSEDDSCDSSSNHSDEVEDHLCEESNGPTPQSPQRVLLRLYGQMHGERALETLVTESVIFALLSERGLGPALHGVFPGGRLEQFIDARALLSEEMPLHSTEIAHKMAAIHTMRAPITKRATWLWETMDTWLQVALENLNSPGRVKRETQAAVARLQTLDLKQEVQWIKRVIGSRSFPVVFCHNDLQCGNILLPLGEQTGLVLIDFEYCSYNYRGFDLANHFIEYMYDYSHKTAPFFKVTRSRYPDAKQQLSFVREYLRTQNQPSAEGREAPSDGTYNCDDCDDSSELSLEEPSDEENELLKETQVFTMVSHLLWGLWSCVNAKMSDIPFGYWEYASERLMSYTYHKQRLSSEIIAEANAVSADESPRQP